MNLVPCTLLVFIFSTCIIPGLDSIDILKCALGRVEDWLCPEDGGWSQWSVWGQCEGECGTVGRQVRSRNCSNPRPERNGLDCDGNQLEVKQCAVPGCSYEQYEKLVAQDPVRQQQLAKLKLYSGSQSSLLTKCLATYCDLSDISQILPSEQIKFWNSLICLKKNTGCPAAGGWGDWSSWTRCNSRCGSGQQMRCRVCCNPPPSTPDVKCQGDACEYQPCNGVICGQPLSNVGEWSSWSDWSVCSASCNFGYMRRKRVCQSQSQISSDKQTTILNAVNDYNDAKNYENADDYYDYFYYNDGMDRAADDSEDSNRDNVDDTQYSFKVAKRSRDCNKVEYYSDNEDEYLLPTTLKEVRDTRKIKKKATGQFEHKTETTDQNSGTFKKTEARNSERKLEAELESMIYTLSSLNPDSEQVTRRTLSRLKEENLLERADENKIIDKESNEVQTKTSTNQSISISLAEPNNKFTKKSLKLKNEGRNKIDENEDDKDECTGELYKISFTAIPCKNRKNGVYVTKSHSKCSSSTVSSSTLTLKSLKADVIDKRPTTSEVNVISLEPSSSSKLPSSTIVLESEVTNSETTIFSEANTVNLETSPSTVTVIETDSVEKSSSFPTSPKTQSLSGSQESSLITRANDFSMESVTTPSVYSAESPSTSTSTKSLFERFPKKTSIVASRTIQELPTSSTFPTTLNLEISEEFETPQNITELNVSITRQISCDLSKKMELPGFSDSFLAEGCRGSFEEIKPCNTQPCNEDGDWSDWSSWSPCSPDCGLGWQVSMRSCTNPEPRRNDSQCQGEAMRRRSCYLQPCSVNLRTEKAVFMTGDSLVRYDAMEQHSSILLLYVRFRHFSPTGSVVARRQHECAQDRNCNHVTLSLYRSHVLISVLQQRCHTDFLTSQRLSIGDWHEVLLTIVGAAVTLRLDDSVLIQKFNLSCRPSTPNYDADMKVGGTRFVGEVDRLSINFKNYAFQKKLRKRDSWPSSDALIVPVESSQVQYEVNSKEVPTVSLSQFLQAPCYTNHSSWNLDFAIKPNIPDGLVLFMRGYGSRDFLFISLEQTRIRLRVRVGAEGGECEHSDSVAPLTWLHLGLSRPPGGPVGLSVNGGPRCVVSLAPSTSDTEEPAVYCTGGILMGEMPLGVKTVLSFETAHAEPIHSPHGLLGHLSVDNHTIDLTRLPRKIAPDLTAKHPDDHYKLSSHTAASTVYYEEMLVLEGERLSMPCIYDLSPENLSDVNSIQELSMNWYKLDSPVKIIFSNESGVYYETPTTGKTFSLNITRYSSMEAVEGFYSCWLIYPLPLQFGFNIVSYGVIIVSTTQDKHSWLFWLMIAHFCFVVILLALLVLWLLYEAYQDYKQGSGFFHCKKLKGEEAYKAIQLFIFSDKAINRLGGMEASEKAFARYLNFLEQEALAQVLRETEVEAGNTTATDTDITSDYEDSHHSSGKEQDTWKNVENSKKKSSENGIFHSFQDQHTYSPTKEHMKPVNVTVGITGVEFDSPFIDKQNYLYSNESRIALEELLQSDTEETREISTTAINDNLIDVSNTWTQKEVTGQTSRDTCATGIGQIQNTFAYRSIKNELKFKPEKFKNLEKYVYSKKNKNDK